MNNKYAIINIETIQKRIEEVKQACNKELGYASSNIYEGLDSLLEESTPLIPVIEKSIKQGIRFGKTSQSVIEQFERKQEYINNLTFNI